MWDSPDTTAIPLAVDNSPKLIDVVHEGRVIVTRFKNTSEYMNMALGKTDMPEADRASRQSHTYAGHSWDNGVGWDGAVRLAELGWPEGIERIEQFTTRLNTVLSGMIKLPEYHYDVTGDFLDVDRFMEGQPECCVSVVDSAIQINASPPRVIRIVVNLFASWSLAPETLIRKGAAVAALVQLLERHGCRCEIDLTAAQGSGIETRFRVKESDAPIHMPNLVFHLAHPASFRRIMFSVEEHYPREVRQAHGFKSGGGYGYKGDSVDRGDIFIEGTESFFQYSDEETLKWIIGQLEAQGVEVEYK